MSTVTLSGAKDVRSELLVSLSLAAGIVDKEVRFAAQVFNSSPVEEGKRARIARDGEE